MAGIQDRHWPVIETLQSSLLGLGVAALGVAPRAVPGVLVCIAALTLAEEWYRGRPLATGLASLAKSRTVQVAMLFLGYALLSTFWSTDRWLGVRSVLHVAITFGATAILVTLLPHQIATLPLPRRNRFLRALPLGGLVAIAFILIEQRTGNAVTIALVNALPRLLAETAKEAIRQDGRVVEFLGLALSRNASAVIIAVPALVAAALCWLRPRASYLIGGLIVICAVIAALRSNSGAAKVASVAGVAVALLAHWRPNSTIRALQIAIGAGVLLAVPLGHLPRALGLDHADWLAPSARERVIIWDTTASAAMRAPLLGIGVQSTRFMPSETVVIPGVNGERRTLGWHAHNFILQAWLELGAVGALLLLALACTLMEALRSFNCAALVAGLATFAAGSAIALTGWGLWQPWLIGCFGLAAVAVALASAGFAAQGLGDINLRR